MRRGRLMSLVLVVLVIGITGTWARGESATGEATAAAACLSGDPYDLAQLAQVIGRASPPSTPVISMNISGSSSCNRGTWSMMTM